MNTAEPNSAMGAPPLPPLSTDSMPKPKRRRTNDHDPEQAFSAISNTSENNNNHNNLLSETEQHASHSLPMAAQSSLPTPTDITDPNAAATDPHGFGTYSPNISFSPWPASFLNSPAETRPGPPQQQQQQDQDLQHAHNMFGSGVDNAFTFGMPEQETPGGMSANGSVPSETDKDPFLSLLEQLAENEHSQQGGPSELDFFLRGQGGLDG